MKEAIARARAAADEPSELLDVLLEVAGDRGDVNPRRLGKWISRHVGRLAGGHGLVRAGARRGVETWGIELVSPVSRVSIPPQPESVTPAGIEDADDANSHGDDSEHNEPLLDRSAA